MITEHMIFVFGSNLSGIHGAGAARTAYRKYGADWGVGEGPTGSCYALPTKGIGIVYINLQEVKKYIDNFIEFSKDVPQNDFKVTQVGCGLGGFTKEQVAPLFKKAAYENSNCYFDSAWEKLLPKSAKFWGTF